MDKQKASFTAIISSQFEELKSSTVNTSESLDSYIDFSLTHKKLAGFANSVMEMLIIPRLKIVEQHLESASVHQIANDAILAVEATKQLPGTGKFRVSYQMNISGQTLFFESGYRITSKDASYVADNWFRSTIMDFRQTEFSEWIEKELFDFATSYHERLTR